ncbi:hypothetical protein SUGI_0479830 [Cryptomeria japonica]|nr:hypothetical protein SUGI_0479830 [Cryptomeria japonica]
MLGLSLLQFSNQQLKSVLIHVEEYKLEQTVGFELAAILKPAIEVSADLMRYLRPCDSSPPVKLRKEE